MFSLIRLLILTRWFRYLIAGILFASAIGTTITAFDVTNIQMKSGTAATLADVVDAQTNTYQYSQLTLVGNSATYEFDRSKFTPALDNTRFVKGGKVDLWYVQTPFNNPSVVALQIYDEQGANPVKYVTADYTHPEDARNRNLIAPAVFLMLGLAAIAAAIFLPAARSSRRMPVPTPSYGASVLSAGQRPRSSDNKGSDDK